MTSVSAMRKHMTHDEVERLFARLDDLPCDDLYAFQYALKSEADYLYSLLGRVNHAIGQMLDEDGATEDRTELWQVERTVTGLRYEYNVPLLREELKGRITPADWESLVITVPATEKVSRVKAKQLAKRGTEVAGILERACTVVPGTKGVKVTPLGDV